MKVLIFDFGNVLCRIDFQKVLRAWARNDEHVLARIAPLYAHDEAYERHERGEIGIDAYREHVCRTLGLELTPGEFVDGWNEVFVGEIEGVRDLLASLKGLYQLVLLSNTNATHAAHFRGLFNALLAPLDRLFLSNEVGMRKPEARFFEHVLAECGVRAPEAMFFDDLPENVRAGESAGIRSVLVQSLEDVHQALSPEVETLALRELREETGYSARELIPVGELFTANGYSTQRCHVFIAKGLQPGSPSLEDEEQGLVARAFPLAEFERMVASGQIRDAATVAALGLARLKGLL